MGELILQSLELQKRIIASANWIRRVYKISAIPFRLKVTVLASRCAG